MIIDAMSESDLNTVMVMGSIHRVLKAEKALLSVGLEVDTIVTPREVSADCGMVLALREFDLGRALETLAAIRTEPDQLWRRNETGFTRLREPVRVNPTGTGPGNMREDPNG